MAAVNATARLTEGQQALQGTWVCTQDCPWAQETAEDLGMSMADFLKRYEIAWIFAGNNYVMQMKDLQSGAIIYAQSGTCAVTGEIIHMITESKLLKGEWSYTLHGNTLTISRTGPVYFICRKQ